MFKVGDKVRCIDSYGTYLTEGCVYIIAKIHGGYENENGLYAVKNSEKENHFGRLFGSRFELIKNKKRNSDNYV